MTPVNSALLGILVSGCKNDESVDEAKKAVGSEGKTTETLEETSKQEVKSEAELTCEKMDEYGFPLVVKKTHPEDPGRYGYGRADRQKCIAYFKEVEEYYSEHTEFTDRHVTLEQLDEFHSYMTSLNAERKEKGLLEISVHFYERGNASSNAQSRIRLNAAEVYSRQMYHEAGHIIDHDLLAEVFPKEKYPEIAQAIENKKDPTIMPSIHLLDAYLRFMESGLQGNELKRFKVLREKYLGSIEDLQKTPENNQLRIVNNFSEVFRYTEEIHTELWQQHAISPYFAPFTEQLGDSRQAYEENYVFENAKGEKVESTRPYDIARFQEVGMWERYQQREGFKAEVAEGVDPELIEFYRLCLRGGKNARDKLAQSKALE